MLANSGRCLLLGAAVLALAGCGGPSVEGKITYAGEPIESGAITFVPTEGGKNQAGGAPIIAGKYKIPAGTAPKPGTYRVEIIGRKKTGQKVPFPGDEGQFMDETILYVPDKYNAESKLTAEIKSGKNVIDFTLEKGDPPSQRIELPQGRAKD
jgi:hypothetical protein